MSEEKEQVECICGAMIHEVSPEVWIDDHGNTNCYPNDPNLMDAAAIHEPLQPLGAYGEKER